MSSRVGVHFTAIWETFPPGRAPWNIWPRWPSSGKNPTKTPKNLFKIIKKKDPLGLVFQGTNPPLSNLQMKIQIFDHLQPIHDVVLGR